MSFVDRTDAARQLVNALSHLRGKNPLVLAIPRGAVPMGRLIADALDGDFDVVLVRKLRAPENPELAIGAVDESGWSYVTDYARALGVDESYIQQEKVKQLEVLRDRRERYSPIHPPIDPRGRVVVVVDDGIATGSTMIAALHALRAKGPSMLICAVPVASPQVLPKLAQYVDEMICIEQPDWFHAVAQFYRDFPQVDDEEVIAALSGGHHRSTPQGEKHHV